MEPTGDELDLFTEILRRTLQAAQLSPLFDQDMTTKLDELVKSGGLQKADDIVMTLRAMQGPGR